MRFGFTLASLLLGVAWAQTDSALGAVDQVWTLKDITMPGALVVFSVLMSKWTPSLTITMQHRWEGPPLIVMPGGKAQQD